ncbi:MAG: hypothetical protein ACI9JD_000097 [Rhodococcus sp. (in: high G+C Gram-positive bacteria)]|jgi:hypothetical protein
MTNTVTAVKIDVNGQATIVELQADGQGVGKAFREALDCRNFDVVRLAPGLDMWIDDEGLFTDNPEVNRVATRIARSYGLRWQPYVGTVVFASSDQEGETHSLSEDQVAALVNTADFGGLLVLDASRDATNDTKVVA